LRGQTGVSLEVCQHMCSERRVASDAEGRHCIVFGIYARYVEYVCAYVVRSRSGGVGCIDISTSQMLSYITNADAQNCALRPAQSALPSNSRKIVTPCVTTLNRTCGHLRLDTCMHRYAAQGPGSRRARQFGPCVTDPIGHGGGGGRRRKSETSKCSRREARTNRRSDRCRFPRTETSRMGATTHTSIDHFGK